MRAQAAGEQRVAVVEQVVRGDGGGRERAAPGHVVGRILRRDVLEHHFQFGEVAAQRLHHGIDEHRLAVEDVDLAVGHLAMHQQQQARALHRLERGGGLADVGDPGVAVRRGARWVELERDHARRLCAPDLVGRRVVGEVQRHQRLEIRARAVDRPRRQDAFAVSDGGGSGGHRRPQVGHHDGPAELARSERQHGTQRRAVAQVQVPVVGAGESEGAARRPCMVHAAIVPSAEPALAGNTSSAEAWRSSSECQPGNHAGKP